MVGSRKDMGEAGMAIEHEPENMLKIFSSPSTLPHLLSLGAFSGFLYIAMKVDLFGSEMQGSIIFLSLSVHVIVRS